MTNRVPTEEFSFSVSDRLAATQVEQTMGKEMTPTPKVVMQHLTGDSRAERKLNDRFWNRLYRTVASGFKGIKGMELTINDDLRPRIDYDVAANSAFRTFLLGLKEGKFSIDRSGAAWQLLLEIAHKKLLGQVDYHRAQKRNPNRESPFDGIARTLTSKGMLAPEEEATLAEALGRLTEQLEPEELDVFWQWLGGRTSKAIAEQVGCTESSVRLARRRIIKLFAKALDELLEERSD